MALNQVFDNIQTWGWSFDWIDQTNRIGVKLHLHCASDAKADLVQRGVQSATALRVDEMEAKLEELENNAQTDSPTVLEQSIDALRNLEMQTSTMPNGTVVVQVKLVDPFPLEEMLREFMSTEVASREPASGEVK